MMQLHDRPVAAERSAADFILKTFEHLRCDSDGVNECVRCNAVALARWMLERLAVETTASLSRFPDNETLKRQILSDPDDDPSAGNVPTQETGR